MMTPIIALNMRGFSHRAGAFFQSRVTKRLREPEVWPWRRWGKVNADLVKTGRAEPHQFGLGRPVGGGAGANFASDLAESIGSISSREGAIPVPHFHSNCY